MHDELDFLNKLLENPADDVLRMVFADWLDERGDDESRAKAKFLRVTVRLMGPIQRVGVAQARQKELRQLAETLPAEWLAVVSRLRVENCPVAQAKAKSEKPPTDDELLERHGLRFHFVCDKRWDELAPTDDATVRRCADCKKEVHYCDSIPDARDRAQRGECVALSLGVIRRPHDLEGMLLLRMGEIGPV